MTSEALTVTAKVVDALESLGVPYVIGGSLASTLHGVARTTLDSDIVADLRPEHLGPLAQLVQDEFYFSLPAMVEALALRGSFNLIHLATAFKVDIFIAKDRPFDRAQRERGRPQVLDQTTGQTGLFASAEDTLLAKLEWHRLGGEQSDRQWRDILGIVAVQGDLLDWVYLEAMSASLEVTDLLTRLQRLT